MLQVIRKRSQYPSCGYSSHLGTLLLTMPWFPFRDSFSPIPWSPRSNELGFLPSSDDSHSYPGGHCRLFHEIVSSSASVATGQAQNLTQPRGLFWSWILSTGQRWNKDDARQLIIWSMAAPSWDREAAPLPSKQFALLTGGGLPVLPAILGKFMPH